MELTGFNFIGDARSGEGKKSFRAFDPAHAVELSPEFYEATPDEIDSAVAKAESSFPNYSGKGGKERALFLETIAEEILALGDSLVKRCSEETGLPESRLAGERGRTVQQLRMFAALLKDGSWVEARIDTTDPNRQPFPKPDIRCMLRALGPVGVFGASNFPLAFSVAGGDTASALAAGCPVVFKAHPAHPGTCEMIATAIQAAAKKTSMPDGTFSMVQGKSTDVGMALVKHPLIKAIGFTGSFRGGKAIFDAAMKRPEPIPVYAEMGSTNPVFILPGALKERGNEIAAGLTASVTLGVGQYCTNPGLVFWEESAQSQQFQQTISDNFQKVTSAAMLTQPIQHSFHDAINALRKHNDLDFLAEGKTGGTGLQGAAVLMKTNADTFLTDSNLEKEVFGPSTLAVVAKSKTQLLDAARALNGHLTATLWATEHDLAEYSELVAILERKVGRLVFNGFPTGVEVCHSMVHGGPFPATTDSRSTSVGTLAISRFTRPVSYQNCPPGLLPDELKDENPLGIRRLVNGTQTQTTLVA